MFDILQLNEMLVPELLDIAERLKLSNTKSLNKRELVDRILHKQSMAGPRATGRPESAQRKRIPKNPPPAASEEMVTTTNDIHPNTETMPTKKDDKAPIKRGRPRKVDAPPAEAPVQEAVNTSIQPEAQMRLASAILQESDNSSNKNKGSNKVNHKSRLPNKEAIAPSTSSAAKIRVSILNSTD
jgi:transcription termination factor Rho